MYITGKISFIFLQFSKIHYVFRSNLLPRLFSSLCSTKVIQSIWQLWIHCNKWQTGLRPDVLLDKSSYALVNHLAAITKWNFIWEGCMCRETHCAGSGFTFTECTAEVLQKKMDCIKVRS